MVREKAKGLGFHETKDAPFHSHGQLKFRKGNIYITPDKDRHKGGYWKMYKNDQRQGTFDETLKKN